MIPFGTQAIDSRHTEGASVCVCVCVSIWRISIDSRA